MTCLSNPIPYTIKTDLDIFRLRSQALVIHELTHAADDFAATGSTSTKEDSLKLETHAYKEQGRYVMDQIMTQPTGSGPGYLNAASQYVHDNPLYYWSMVAAAKGDVTKYEATLVSIKYVNAPMTKNRRRCKSGPGVIGGRSGKESAGRAGSLSNVERQTALYSRNDNARRSGRTLLRAAVARSRHIPGIDARSAG